MKKTFLVLLVALAAALTAVPAAGAKSGPCLAGVPGSPTCTMWDAKVAVVDDGDTVQAQVKTGKKFGKRQSVRINGVQAMEIHHYGHGDKRSGDCHSVEASRRLEELVQGKMVRLTAQKESSTTTGEGGRVRARRSMAVQQGGQWVDVGSIMIREGWGLPFGNGTEWASNGPYMALAQQAAAAGKNLWDPTGCGVSSEPGANLSMKVKWDADGGPGGVPDEQNINGEFVRITNNGAVPVNIGDWWLRDSHFRGPRAGDFKGRGYEFPGVTIIPAGGSIEVHVGSGANSATDLYMGYGEPIFENVSDDKKEAGDGAYLFDPEGNLREYAMYPCRAGNCTDPLANVVAVRARYQGGIQPGTGQINEWIYIKNNSGAPVSLNQYELESTPWFYEFGPADVIQPGKEIVLWIAQPYATVPAGPGQVLKVPPIPGVGQFADTQVGGFRSWNFTEALLGDGKDVVTLRNPRGAPVACDAWGGERCPTI